MRKAVERRRSGLLGRLWAAWTRFGKRLAALQARALLTVFYFLVLPPFALAIRLAADPLALKPGSARGWRLRDAETETALTRARQQF